MKDHGAVIEARKLSGGASEQLQRLGMLSILRLLLYHNIIQYAIHDKTISCP